MKNLKVGMYVRASIEINEKYVKNSREFALGQVEDIDEDDLVLVMFHKNFRKRGEALIHELIPNERKYISNNLHRCKILKGSKIIWELRIGTILEYAGKDEEEFYEYYIKLDNGQIKKINELEIMVDFNRADISPLHQMGNYEFHQPYWYAKREVASEAINMIDNFGTGFKTLIGSRSFLFEHQIDTIVRGLKEKKCRLMLADEVGLGKTIEALVILKGLKKKKDKVLLIIPEALVNQWKNELEVKLWMESIIFNGQNLYEKDIVIVATEKIKELDLNKINGKFDFCIIDEVHRTVGEEDIYNKIYSICNIVTNVLLLSATPIQNRKEEYLMLLRLLNPEKYDKISEKEFSDLYEKNSKIRKYVHKAYKELTTAYSEKTDEDSIEEIYECLEDISHELNDIVIKKMLNEFDIDSEDKGESIVREILAYVSINYQFEKNIIRHRREELKDILPKRSLETLYYEMKSGADNYFEYNCYELVIDYIDKIKENKNEDYSLGEYIRIVLNSMFSSPWALKSVLEERKEIIVKGILKSQKSINIVSSQRKERERIRALINNVQVFSDELSFLHNLLNTVEKWCNASNSELNNINYYMDNPYEIKGRITTIIDYIEQELYSNKVVIFTSWAETLGKMRDALATLYGEEAVSTFYINDDIQSLEKNVYRFQNDDACKFMLCDELGGEGRNFQIADAIIHVDLPFSPTLLEQRIGRLDRIGRSTYKNVLNIIPVSEGTIENSLFDLWNEGLNIFNESLSGLEIALEDINKDVIYALKEDMRYGLDEAINSIKEKLKLMKKIIQEERYYDMARQLDKNTKKRYDNIINHFDKNGGRLLGEIMLNWSTAVGFVPSSIENGIVEFNSSSVREASMKNTMFSIPDTSESLKRSKKSNSIRGTFDRTIAVNKEDLVFFAPGEEIFESIITNVIEGYKGKSTGIRILNAPFDWEGFIFKWNKSFKISELLNNNIDLNYESFAHGHMSIKQYTSYIPICDTEIKTEQIKNYIYEELNNYIMRKRDSTHIGKRDNKSIDRFKVEHPYYNWRSVLNNAYNESKKEVKDMHLRDINKDKIKKDLSQIYYGAKISEKYFNESQNSEELKAALEAVLRGIVKSNINLDSIIYLKMEKQI